jgi:hypothetical protein
MDELKLITIVEISKECSMNLCKHTIWPGSYIEKNELEIRHFKWIQENNAMFPNYNDNVFQTTLNSCNESTTITIDYIKQELKLRKDSIEANSIKTKQLLNEIKSGEDIHEHTNITFYSFFTLFLISFAIIFDLYYEFIHPITCKRKFMPTSTNEIELGMVKKTENNQHPLYPSVNTTNA